MDKLSAKILAVTDREIVFDALSEQGGDNRSPCTHHKVRKEMVAYTDGTTLAIYNTETRRKHEHSIPGIKRIEISPNGRHVVAQTQHSLVVVEGSSIRHRIEKPVKTFELSSKYLVYTVQVSEPLAVVTHREVSAVSIQVGGKEEGAAAQYDLQAGLGVSRNPQRDADDRDAKKTDIPDTVAPKTQEQKTLPAGKEALDADRKKKKEEKPRVRIQKKEGLQNILIQKVLPTRLCALRLSDLHNVDLNVAAPFSYAAFSSYLIFTRLLGESGGEIEVFDLQLVKSTGKMNQKGLISVQYITDPKHGSDAALCLCTLSGRSTTYYDAKILYLVHPREIPVFSRVPVDNPICDLAFLRGNTFAVCYGNSPSRVSIFNGKPEKIQDLKQGIRNRMVFNRQENIVCLAGINNLPGVMEICEHPSNAFLSPNEIIGCSVIDWSPCGRFYLVAVTNKMSAGNKIEVFDYYSRKLAEAPFSALVDARFLGADQAFCALKNPPEKIKIEKKEAYVPPSLRKEETPSGPTYIKPHIIKTKEVKLKSRERKVQALLLELQEIEEIEENMNRGKIVPGGIIKIQKKDGLLKKLAAEQVKQKDEKK